MLRTTLTGGLATAALAIGLIGASSAGAAPAGGKDACKNGGHVALGFANQGRCVAAANAADSPENNLGGGGEGGFPAF